MAALIRNFKHGDYQQCEDLVEQAWGLINLFDSRKVSDLARLAYTRGSLESSNYKKVLVLGSRVEGFIFGLNESGAHPRADIRFRALVLWKILQLKNDRAEWDNLYTALKIHVRNRSDLVMKGQSEIQLFIVNREHQGKGYGKELWSGFKDHCAKSQVKTILVSTNTQGASSFYEKIGFGHVGNFASPLHEIAKWKGQPCMYEFKC